MLRMTGHQVLVWLGVISISLLTACSGGAGGSTSSATYSVGVTVSGLNGGGLVLQNNGGDDLSISADGNFSFATEIADGGVYDVTVLTQPSSPGQTCAITNGSGNISGAAINNISIACVTNTYSVSVSVSGLTGSGLVLQNNGGDNLSISADGSFSFATGIADGGAYDVTVLIQPATPNQLCSVTNGSGIISGAAINNISIACVTNTYSVSVTVSGLTGTGLVLQNNGGDDLSFSVDGSLSFNTEIIDGGAYDVTVLTQPSGQHCAATNGSGTIAGAAVSNVAVQCVWTKQLGATGTDTIGYSVATDTSGNIYVAGYTIGGLDGNTMMGTIDHFITRYNSVGVKQYTKQLGATWRHTYGQSVATDASGNVYVAGYTDGGLDGNTLTGTYDFYVTKYNSLGVKQYTRQLGVAGASTFGRSVTTDASGNVYVAGDTDGGLDGNTLTGTNDFFVTKYNSAGVKQYTRQLGVSPYPSHAYSVATDASGNVYVAGTTTGGLDGNTRTGHQDFFITKYNSAGVKQYTRQLGVAGLRTYGRSVATDSSGNVYVAGYTPGGLDGNTLTGTWDLFVTKYDSTGVKQYTKQLGVAGVNTYAWSTATATDASGNVYVAGYTFGGLDGNTLTGTNDFIVIKYDSTGVKQYTRQLGAAGAATFGRSVATDGSGNVYVAGYTDGDLDGHTNAGAHDFFAVKYDGATGTKQ